MILIVIISSIFFAGVTVYQYNIQNEDYHREMLERKELQLKAQIDYELRSTTYEVKTSNLKYIFLRKIYEIANVQSLNFNIFDLEGHLIIGSKSRFADDSLYVKVPPYVLDSLKNSVVNPETNSKRYVEVNTAAGERYQSSYTYILDQKFKPIGILNIPYFEDNTFYDYELQEFLMRQGGGFLIMFGIAILLAYLISSYITRSLKSISQKLDETRLSKRNEKIYLEDPSEEIGALVDAYNGMIDELEKSAVLLAKSEREQAWREMAKQVAHEIKNPLTPMRLSVQNFERKFDANDPEASEKLAQFSHTLIQQIDTLSSIASAFSNFANMPAQQNETLNVVKVVKLALDIFTEDYIRFFSDEEEVIVKMDRTQLIRVITNLVKNAIQAIPEDREPKIMVNVFSDCESVKITVADNGLGIAEENSLKIFEPKFTTKTSGMGLGLGMVRNMVENYNGTISFTSLKDKGTVFTVSFPKCKPLSKPNYS
ncbi:sensor histidine kinase [Robertkochia solimangrovi]|uniref:sensor histidine kinase n=1 Tax=Robertkochia solimangrovi TaxID=2213046 RepID=UPI001180C8EF|nr:HAMP domain-containing sensor histidine kinase [Robertkochia solimangrovi]TRZ45946.1 two-component sensor histidine kinase [Robertkochia solimangrovi]